MENNEVEDKIEDVEDKIEDVEDKVDDVEDKVEDIEGKIEDVEEIAEDIQSQIEGVKEGVTFTGSITLAELLEIKNLLYTILDRLPSKEEAEPSPLNPVLDAIDNPAHTIAEIVLPMPTKGKVNLI